MQIHGKADDEFFAHEGDIDAARELVATIGADRAELFVYPGDQHLFVESSLPGYDADAAALVLERTLHFLGPDSTRAATVAPSGTGSNSPFDVGSSLIGRRPAGNVCSDMAGSPVRPLRASAYDSPLACAASRLAR